MKQHIVNVHIPKTAGSALRQNLAYNTHRSSHKIPRILGVAPKDNVEYFQGLSEGFSARLPQLFHLSSGVLSGHYRYRDIADILAPQRDRVSLITFLRDPIWRTVSDYFYSISDVHPGAEIFRSTYPTFEHYMSSQGEMNKMTDFLRPEDGCSAQETLHFVCRSFDFIGISENFSKDLVFIANSLGVSLENERRVNENMNKNEMLRAYEKYAPVLRDILREDFVLYEGVLEHRGLSMNAG